LFPKINIPVDGKKSFITNHLLIIDDLKLLSEKESDLLKMIEETRLFFSKIGLEINKEKTATNCESTTQYVSMLNQSEEYKYLGIFEASKFKFYKIVLNYITKVGW
jgi:hypothetical protein